MLETVSSLKSGFSKIDLIVLNDGVLHVQADSVIPGICHDQAHWIDIHPVRLLRSNQGLRYQRVLLPRAPLPNALLPRALLPIPGLCYQGLSFKLPKSWLWSPHWQRTPVSYDESTPFVIFEGNFIFESQQISCKFKSRGISKQNGRSQKHLG